MRNVISGLVKSVLFGVALVAPTLGFGQRTFTYGATDMQTKLLTGPGSMTCSVVTVIVIQQSPAAAARSLGPTRAIDLVMEPPTVTARLLNVSVGDQMVGLRLMGSTVDGQLKGTAEIPLALASDPIWKLDWMDLDGTVIETTQRAASQ